MPSDFVNAVKRITDSLSENRLIPQIRSITTDGSVLLQFLGDQKACVDIYPSGAVAVLIRHHRKDDLHPFSWDDAELISTTLKLAGVKAPNR